MSELSELLTAAGFSCFSSLEEWQVDQQRSQMKHAARWHMAQSLRSAEDRSAYDGWCELCQQRVQFSMSETPHCAGVWFFRDDAVCNSCLMMARLRLGAVMLQRLLAAQKPRIYVNEQISHLFPWLLRNFDDVTGSEYAPDPKVHEVMQRRLDWVLRDLRIRRWYWKLRGRVPGRLQHQDATALKYADRRFNAVMSFDVLEHIPNYRAALRELARVLQPGGYAILTAPFLDNQQHTCLRARMSAAGVIEHLLPPEYHGDPMVAGNQILCFQVFGWDVLDELRNAGFSEAWTVYRWNPGLGFPSQIPTWVARR